MAEPEGKRKKGTRKGFAIGVGIASVAIIAAIFALSGAGGRSADQAADIEVIRLLNAHIWIAPNGTTSVAGFVGAKYRRKSSVD